MSAPRAERVAEIAAPPAGCYAVLLGFEAYPEWQPAVSSAVVHERDEEGRGTLVEFTADALIRRIGYTVRYHHEPPGRMWWELVSGDVKAGDGEFRLEALDGGARTRATYRLVSDLGFHVPGPLLRRGTELLMSGVLRGLAERAEPAV